MAITVPRDPSLLLPIPLLSWYKRDLLPSFNLLLILTIYIDNLYHTPSEVVYGIILPSYKHTITMPSLNPDVLLTVAEQADDLKVISTLMCTSTGMNALFATYEHSIAKTKLAMRPGGSSILPPSGTILSSFDQERVLIAPNTFMTIQELDLRTSRINILMGPGEKLVC